MILAEEGWGGHSTVVMTVFSISIEHLSCSPGGPGRVCAIGSDGGGLSWPADIVALVCSEGTQPSVEDGMDPTPLSTCKLPDGKDLRGMPHFLQTWRKFS